LYRWYKVEQTISRPADQQGITKSMKTILQFKSINFFSTERLIAKKITENDLEKFRLMHTNENVMRTLGGLRNEDQTVDNLSWNLKQWEDNGFGLWMFFLKETGEWVGRGGLRRVEVGGNTEVEVGYALMPKFWNQGLATEITKACIEIAFEVIRLDDVVSFTLTTNKSSQRVMEKSGFKYERDIIHADLPHVLYRMKNTRKVELVVYDKNWPDSD
jgi:[ribosomal protein S5]-alanine N-acetyltransferase